MTTAQLALDWTTMRPQTSQPPASVPNTPHASQNGARDKFALRSDVDWSERNDPLSDPRSLLRIGSPRLLCNNGCHHVFAGESTYERHLVLLEDGQARCRTPAELRSLPKRPMFRDVAGVWHSGETVKEEAI